MRRRHRRTLADVFRQPTPAGIRWDDIESLLRACGAHIEERAGSRVGVELNGARAIFHRPHPRKEAGKASVSSIRRFLMEAGVRPGRQGGQRS
ncbi:MAG: type II toxin-antitoxin system HicA family toxin [Chloroflexi bacterium]|nr:type II toxin-antitoxin system HicA family toxin [Chloroflexota bacterium]